MNDLKKYGYGKAKWENIEFTIGHNFDRTAIFTSPYKDHMPYKKENAVTFLTEPPESKHYYSFHETAKISPMYLPLSFWVATHKKNRTKILKGNLIKSNILSSITSELYELDGHKKRLQFIYYLDKKIESGFDLFGRKYTGDFFKLIRAYRGEIKDKFSALVEYEYNLACENSSIKNYFTEKILDPIIAETLCIYDGCKNINEFIDERAFIKIDMNNIDQSIDIIIKAIYDNEYIKRIKYIINQKKRLLWELNPLNIIWLEMNEKDVVKELKI